MNHALVLRLVEDLPPELSRSECWAIVLDPSGLFIVATEPMECPGCHTAHGLFFVERRKREPGLSYHCLACPATATRRALEER